MKNLIITAGYGYSSGQLKPFLISAGENVPSAHLVLFADRNDPEFSAQILSLNPRVHIFVPADSPLRNRRWPRGVRGIPKIARAINRIMRPFSPYFTPKRPNTFTTALFHVALARYIWIQSFLQESGSDIDMILLADSRDVFFQDDPFKHYQGTLVCGEEPVRIEDSALNSAWIERAYSKEWVERLSKMPVLCSGVTLGSHNQICTYLNAMVSEITSRKRWLISRPGDQGIHNKIFHGDKILPFTTSKNGDPLLATLYYSKLDEFDIDRAGFVKTKQGEMVSIVHQYDRHQVLVDMLKERYQ